MKQMKTAMSPSAPRLLPAIEASYQPSRSVTKIPATSPLDKILEILERDGGVILTDFVSCETLDKIDMELEPYTKPPVDSDSYDDFIGKKTLVIPGLVGKSDTIANILDTNETIEELLKVILEERYPAVFENHTEELVVEPLLSIAMAFNVSEGSPRQALHRDDMIFHSRHHAGMKINEQDGFSCFIAGTRVTRENGGTMIILGSHKWEHERHGRPDEVSFLEMERGSAFIFLSSMAHGAGYNTIPGEVRKIINLVFCRGILRQEENQFLCNPRSKVLKMSPKLQTLLGFKKPPKNWLGMVENEDPTKDLAAVYEKMLA
ncbi:phytanoyl- dioxygenase [Pyrenophora seminiperda CCB06]|uniref:Phytanoyl-dioxygenase n=1 Tax=Pyrenophora seminiperda CCB06 TaxID=1302712 RepID=A0A3M7MGI6_9PLEO|nr:phytanoyl- dioxygenase [Pyrenophora seminiperda CCB06]